MEHLPFWDFRPYLAIGAVLCSDVATSSAAPAASTRTRSGCSGAEGLRSVRGARPAAPAAASRGPSRQRLLRAAQRLVATRRLRVRRLRRAGGRHARPTPCRIRCTATPTACRSSLVAGRPARPRRLRSLLLQRRRRMGGALSRNRGAQHASRSTARDQALHIGKMAWSHSYHANPEAMVLGTIPRHRRVTRRVFPSGWRHDSSSSRVAAPRGYVIVTTSSSVVANMTPNSTFSSHQVSRCDDVKRRFDGNVDLTWSSNHIGLDARRTAWGATPGEGWIAPSLGVRKAAPRLTFLRKGGAAVLSHLDGDCSSQHCPRLFRIAIATRREFE